MNDQIERWHREILEAAPGTLETWYRVLDEADQWRPRTGPRQCLRAAKCRLVGHAHTDHLRRVYAVPSRRWCSRCWRFIRYSRPWYARWARRVKCSFVGHVVDGIREVQAVAPVWLFCVRCRKKVYYSPPAWRVAEAQRFFTELEAVVAEVQPSGSAHLAETKARLFHVSNPPENGDKA